MISAKKRRVCQTTVRRLSDPFDSLPTIVCDPGTFSTKLGFAGDLAPREYRADDFMKAMHIFIGIDENDRFPSGASVALVTDGFESRKWHRENLEILFEQYDVSKVSLSQSPALVLVAAGRSTGLVVDVGHRKSRVVPVFEGFADWRAAGVTERGGQIIDQYLAKKIPTVCSLAEFKHTECFAASSADALGRYLKLDAETNVLSRDFRLPDGQRVQLQGGAERVAACEELLRSGNELVGLTDLIDSCVASAAIDLRRPLLQNVLLTGGTSDLRGLDVRLTGDLKQIEHLEKTGKHAAFQGAATLAQTYRHFADWWITKAEVSEKGPELALAKVIHP